MNRTFLGKYFSIYCKFFNSDIESSVISDRNFNIIEAFYISLMVLIEKDISIANTKEYLKNLEKVVNIENEMYNNLKIYDCDTINKIDKLQRISVMFELTIHSFIVYSEAYQITYNAYTKSMSEEEVNHRLFQDLLIEFNNALSHLLTAITSNNKKVVGKNTNRAKTHLLRGALDSYKELIGLNNDLVINSSIPYPRLNNMTMYEYYLTLREMEAKSIGSIENNIKIIEDYEKLCKAIINH